MAETLYDAVRDLPLRVEECVLEDTSVTVGAGWERHTTLVRLRGGGHEGVGEDVTYEPADQAAFQQAGPPGGLAGDTTLDGFSALLEGLEPLGTPVTREPSHQYRRWAFESAALDLALRQAGVSLADALDIPARPVRFVVSMGLGDPPSSAPVDEWLALDPGLRFKLDATPDWDDRLVAELSATGTIDCIDLKGWYVGTIVDTPADPDLYRLVAEGFPQAVIEDAALTDDTDPVLEPHRDRLAFDFPIHAAHDLDAFAFPLRVVNIKPSRFGSLRALFETYETCHERGIAMYGGGQFELGVGRGQIQYLASLFHPDGPNDVAPQAYNLGRAPGLPGSPLAPAPEPTGFRWVEQPAP
ncbi:MAG: hypothetical protein ACTHNU_13270 [Gaiellales bacterium]